LNFLRFNAEEIKENSGYAPVRAYFCMACGCWHVSSRAEYNHRSFTEVVIAAANVTLPKVRRKACRYTPREFGLTFVHDDALLDLAKRNLESENLQSWYIIEGYEVQKLERRIARWHKIEDFPLRCMELIGTIKQKQHDGHDSESMNELIERLQLCTYFYNKVKVLLLRVAGDLRDCGTYIDCQMYAAASKKLVQAISSLIQLEDLRITGLKKSLKSWSETIDDYKKCLKTKKICIVKSY